MTASEKGLAYDVLGPLWAVIDLGAVAEAPEARPVRDFVSAHRAELDALLEVVRELGDFSAETMKLLERQGGWGSAEPRSVTAESLMLYSGCIEAYPPSARRPHCWAPTPNERRGTRFGCGAWLFCRGCCDRIRRRPRPRERDSGRMPTRWRRRWGHDG